ncbi:protein FAR1-RELATED SEQUENCE 5-like [Nymphaea colorata]|nr:protein FAR1-RELATED SEQUENCE 5-like [Nymphaea colorata]XP_049937208.1 protein FAR1-RELATED SEQUENCE 5-like [Nymphaea colorata]XP_049937209.1 protein FAR1-RELATED SEQUENCE 5-like [Nymphaea colorata]XP_049937210.1 protein FAR1-RELATED SEQUENCE 5-like [Nymphaea colorata]XP_049937211.1 protein FAR1-RELATED SEQUENCE 5-like [Nymphaea colorata]XP_049937212.1 protein FAR1-RELATED SEQUENCE 5-like [Nymphaea colorata]XP_049937213.1 protein FAR1-RELATED SEQUENCE 5-like [Nymphaea colorata]
MDALILEKKSNLPIAHGVEKSILVDADMHEDGSGKSDTCKDHSHVHEVEEIVPIDADIHKQASGEFDTHKDNLDAHGLEESISLDGPMHIQGSDEFDTPHDGMEFSDNEDAFNFYNNYALTHGFSVRKDSQDKNDKGIVVRKTYVCSKEGLLKHSKANKIHRGTTRCGCPAKMVIRRLSNGRFVVKTFIADHNHLLAPPTIARMLRSHRKVKRAHAAIEELASDIGTTPRQTYNYISKLDGGHENVSLTSPNLRNHLQERRESAMGNGEIHAVVNYLQKKSSMNPGFYSAFQLDEDAYVMNIFWADARSRLDYTCFNDILVFDTTMKIKTNKWPFAQFVGVNHHAQSCIFGSAFLYVQTIESLVWLFAQFTEAMNGVHPQVVLTDEDSAIASAITQVWPNANQRFCPWHIFQNAINNVGHIFSHQSGFKESLSKCMLKSKDEESFLCSWNEMLDEYQLHNNLWLQKLYKDKEKWSPAYDRQYFCADMISVQRIESTHAILEKNLYSCLTIFQFLEQYESFLENLRKNELQQDYKAFSTVPVTMGIKVLMRAVDVYTPTVFEWVKIEAVAAINCTIDVISCNDNVHRYNVEACVVTYNTENTTLQCSCRKFEFSGVLCCHAMKVLDRENIKEIPTAYVWRRWTKNAKTDLLNASSIPMTGRVDRCRTISRYQHLCRTFLHIAEIASKSEEMYQYVIAMQKKTLRSVGNMHMQIKRLCE